tara:strand:- start:924 stop:1511 length:588 start_codon:yes stop_codon:yes gene_type:complete
MSDLTIKHAGSTITRSADSPGSSISTGKYKVIRVTPTITEDSAYADGDSLFNATEIPNAVRSDGGTSKLLSAYVVDEDSQVAVWEMIFTQKATNFANSGMHNTADVTFDNAVASNICGFAVINGDTDSLDIDNFKMQQTLTGIAPPSTGHPAISLPILLQAEEGSTSVYVQGVIFSGTPTYTNTDSLQLIFHIEY